MAAYGFNICIVARNKPKMAEKQREIETRFDGKIKTMSIAVDFAEMRTYKEYESAL